MRALHRSTYVVVAAAVVVLGSAAPSAVNAAAYRWVNPGGGNWAQSGNWNNPGYPSFFWDFAIFTLDGSYTVDASDASRIGSVAGVQVVTGDVDLSTYSGFRTILSVGIAGMPAKLTLTGGVVNGVGPHTIGPYGTLCLAPGSGLQDGAGGTYGFDLEPGGVLRGDDASLDGQVLRNLGTVSPGLSPGASGVIWIGRNLPSGYEQRNGGTLLVDLAGTDPGTGYDQLRVADGSRGVSLGGNLVVALAPGYAPADGDRYQVLAASGYTGAFDAVTLPDDGSGVTYEVTYEPDGVWVTADGPSQVMLSMDVQPGACPNPLNVRKQGVVPAAVLGTADFDVHDVDPTSLRLEGVAPLRWTYEDVSTPAEGEACACGDQNGDGLTDLTLKFSAPDLVDALGAVADGDQRLLTLTGALTDGTPVLASDCVVLQVPGNGKKSNDAGVEPAPSVHPASSPSEPVQTAGFDLPEASAVRLDVVAVTGRLVGTLVDEALPAGSHTADWNAAGVPNGVYFYILKTDRGTVSSKVLVIR
jgi:hypothetical protein